MKSKSEINKKIEQLQGDLLLYDEDAHTSHIIIHIIDALEWVLDNKTKLKK